MTVVVALDVGITTGVVIANLQKRRIEQVLYHTNVLYTDLPTQETHAHTPVIDIYKTIINQGAEILLVEWPYLNNHSNNMAEVARVKTRWQAIVEALSPIIPVVEIRPVDWKSTHAKLFDTYEVMPGVASKHEKDACRMMYWYAVFKYGK